VIWLRGLGNRMREIVLATHNLGKVRELRELLKDLPLNIKSLQDFPDLPEIKETGRTFRENARIKAAAVFKYTGITSLADDSGLEVGSLNGAPGVYSSRYAGEERNDPANNKKLLQALADIPIAKRQADFRSVICLKLTTGEELYTEGICQGRIAFEAKGENGFGYDPLFLAEPDYLKTMAELSLAEKNAVSHRGRAFKKMKTILEQLLKEGKI